MKAFIKAIIWLLPIPFSIFIYQHSGLNNVWSFILCLFILYFIWVCCWLASGTNNTHDVYEGKNGKNIDDVINEYGELNQWNKK